MNYQVGNYISTEYGELPIKHIVFDQYQVTGKDSRTLWANKVESIELTEDWLIIFGFVKSKINGQNSFYKSGIHLVHISNYFELQISGFGIILSDIKQVHKLQNFWYEFVDEELKRSDA